MSRVKKDCDYIFNYSYPDVFNAIIDAARQARMTVGVADYNRGFLHLSTSISILSWGENIDIYLQPQCQYRTAMHIISDSVVDYTLYDWGMNKRNIKTIITGVNNLLYAHYNR